MTSLLAFTTALLNHSGAVVEQVGDDLEVLFPEDVAEALDLPDHVRLTFPGEGKSGALLSYESELFRRMGDLLAERGRFSAVSLPAFPVRPDKLKERLSEKVILRNAVFALDSQQEDSLSYLLGCFRYIARSDDRQEGITALLINERNFSVRPFPLAQLDLLEDAMEEPGERTDQVVSGEVLKALLQAQAESAREALSEFIKSLERRLNRDIVRVHQYYQTLLEEARRTRLPEGERVAARRGSGEEEEKACRKLEAIEAERKWKIHDLVSKYRLSLQTEPISFIRIETKGPIFRLVFKRRKGTRSFPLTYNPIVKGLDPLPCEGCFYPKKVSFICDDRLHVVCPSCFAACPRCGKEVCRACRPGGCPKCAVT